MENEMETKEYIGNIIRLYRGHIGLIVLGLGFEV